ncbi:MAG: ATP-binding protein [Verrucomicrobiae bacterium]|nr:ATP-binding protein [Verrucomicrobiae bacterium]
MHCSPITGVYFVQVFERAAALQLERWIAKPHRKPLVIRGARQVGKSTLVRQFAGRKKRRLFEVNLERHPSLARVIDSLDPRSVLREIEFLADRGEVNARDSLVFLDEVQAVPKALQCLRYFLEELPDLPVVAAGSLLEFTLAEHSFPMPVGRVEYFHLGPVSWEEFLSARGETQLLALLGNYTLGEVFPNSAHDRLLRLLREFLLVGGMPEAVQVFLEQNHLPAVFEIHDSIIETYRDDFSKYATGTDLVRLQRVMDYLGRHVCEKVKYSNIDRESQAREVRRALDLLIKAGVVFAAIHSHGDGVPLRAHAEERVFKLYNLDLSFFNRASGITSLREVDLLDRRFINEGCLAEQFVAQQLHFASAPGHKPELHYWLREGRTGNAEVDFLQVAGTQVFPVEVKAGKAGSLKSLVQFAALRGNPVACRLDLNPPSRQTIRHVLADGDVRFEMVSLPLMMCGQMGRLVESAIRARG